MFRSLLATIIASTFFLSFTGSAQAQVTVQRPLPSIPNRTATLEQQLNSQLRATTEQQKAYIKFLVKQVKLGKLEAGLVVAIQRKSVARNRYFPFPFFERAMRYEAAKRNVALPKVEQFVTGRISR